MESHLLQMRGLKLTEGTGQLQGVVASFTDAWIETNFVRISSPVMRVASFTDAWIETTHRQARSHCCTVASFTDAWIETFLITLQRYKLFVASFTDAWIETHINNTLLIKYLCRIFYRCVD